MTNNWISVEERLPEQKQRVLCFAKGDRMFTSIYVDGEFLAWDEDDDCEAVTHWMPLPENPNPIK